MYYEVNDQVIKREKAAAREIRASRWWQNKIATNAVCYYCQKPLSKEEATMDHILPLVRGGTSSKSNLVVCCKPCNNSKKDKFFDEWQNELKALI